MLHAALIGFPSTGKSTLFQLMTSAKDAPRGMLVYVVNDGTTIPWFASMKCDSSTWPLAKLREWTGLRR